MAKAGKHVLSRIVDLSNGDSGEGAAVLLFPPVGAELEPVRWVIAGMGGSFAFTGLRPETYSVVALREKDVPLFPAGRSGRCGSAQPRFEWTRPWPNPST